MPDYSEAVERVARAMLQHDARGAVWGEASSNGYLERSYLAKAAVAVTAAGANESQGDDFDYKRWGQERHQLVESLRAENERLRESGAKIQEAAEKKGARLSKENERLKADYDELVIQAAKERGILNAEQAENERLREEVEDYKQGAQTEADAGDEARAKNGQLREALALALDSIDRLMKFVPDSDKLKPLFVANIVAARAALSSPTNRKDAE